MSANKASEHNVEIDVSKSGYGSINAEVQKAPKAGEPGFVWRSKDYYAADWWNSFDMFFLIFMAVFCVIMLVATWFLHPKMYTQWEDYKLFWVFQFSKMSFMCFVAFLGGLIVTQLGVKVNYTRKIQHFCAYLIPMVTEKYGFNEVQFGHTTADHFIITWWGYWFTLMSFMALIYPIRTRVRFVDIMFASLDRPEDRPYTLYWMSSQVFLGYVILSTFKTYCSVAGLDEVANLAYIPVLITGIGDGLAEPVGYRFGKHKYATRGFCNDRMYTRSYEGSACVLISGFLSCIALSQSFSCDLHFLLAFFIVPIAMTFAEAFSPHTWDTPFLLTSGCGLLWLISYTPRMNFWTAAN